MWKQAVRTIIFLQIIFLAGVTSSFAQKKFEGTVDLKYDGSRSSNEIRYYAKADMARIEMGNNAGEQNSKPRMGTIIVKNHEMFILMPSRKAYIEKPLNLKEKMKEMDKKGGDLTKTGNSKKILGYNADQWMLKNEKGEVEIWSTSDLGSIELMQGIGSTSAPAWLEKLNGKEFFPLLVIQRDAQGKEINRLEVTNVDKKTVDPKYFEIPSDYKKADTGGNIQERGRTGQ
ncbi:MAG: DUF4412 domain-containing protein [Ignavibacteriales bacterium]